MKTSLHHPASPPSLLLLVAIALSITVTPTPVNSLSNNVKSNRHLNTIIERAPSSSTVLSRRESLLSGGVAAASLLLCPHSASASPSALTGIYDKAAGSYDDLYGNSKVGKSLDLNDIRRSTLSFASGAVLELGVGTGLNLPYYPQTGTMSSLSAIDLSPEMLARAKEKQQFLPTSIKQVDFQTADATNLPFPDGTYDTVVDTFGLCVFEDPVAVLREAHRVLVQGGLLLICETDDSLPSRIFGSARTTDVSRSCRPDDNVLGLIKASGGFEVVETEPLASGMFRRVVARKM
jgi:methyltransferase OMS1